MATFHIDFPDSVTVDRTLVFLGRSYTYQWNRTDMRQPDFREQILADYPELVGACFISTLDSLSYCNDDISSMVGELTEYEALRVATVVQDGAPPQFSP